MSEVWDGGHDVAKLPVWAQDYVGRLLGRIDELERDIDRARGDATGAIAFRTGKRFGDPDTPVAWSRDEIEFPMGDDTRISIRVKHGELVISDYGGGRVVIRPIAGNVFAVSVKADRS
jgi:hypothetical protein